MATWHQSKRPVDWTKTNGYVLVTDAPHEMTTSMTFDSEEMAKESLSAHREKQPHKSHFLYYNGRIIA